MTLLERLPLSKQGNLIRLVTILPSDQFDAEIKCTLACYSLNDYLNFEALSYTWMGAGYTQAISLNDEEFFVVPNVEAALRYLRYQTRERRLWIDSICINQADIDEKNIHKAHAAVYESAIRLLGRQYFQRVWVLQEVAVAANVLIVCGFQYLPWEMLIRARKTVRQQQTITEVNFARVWQNILAMEACRRNYLATTKSLTTEMSTEMFLRFLGIGQCRLMTDPRDRIYAVVGIGLSSPHREQFSIDYGRSEMDLYLYLARFILEMCNDLRILYSSGMWKRTEGLPSWVPNWRGSWYDMHHFYSIIGQMGQRLEGGAGKGTNPDFRISTDSTILSIMGFIAGRITTCMTDAMVALGICSPDGIIRHEQLPKALLEIENQCDRTKPTYQTGLTRREELLATLTILIDDNMSDGIYRLFAEWYSTFIDPENLDEAAFTRNKDETQLDQKYSSMLLRGLKTYRLFTTDQDHIGFTPYTSFIRRGDVVCIFNGAKLPLLIRKQGSFYTLLGACYVYGLMDGESIPNLDRGQYSQEEFQLV
ncbi:hypothetical protein N431DRAFT_554674 [Stipitochalara longipes BDJ]|nr:hypothetical protein N431DRAFT_554674 [Stipitochalara longipes BDJ]